VQRPLWETIFDLARELNVQVVATTHSRDSVEAFEMTTSERPFSESALVSLRRNQKSKEREVVAVVSDKEEMEVIVESGIEVR